jgi:hypothetical protein
MIAAALTTLTSSLYGAPASHPYGPNLSYGDVSNGQTVLSDTTNPAATAEKLKSGDKSWSVGILPHIGVGVEYGAVDNLFDEIDATADNYKNVTQQFTTVQQTTDGITNTINDMNRILQLVEDGGYGKAVTSVQFPFTPIGVSGILGGALSFDVSGHVSGRIGALGDTINFDAASIRSFINDIDQLPNPNNTLPEIAVGDVIINYDIGDPTVSGDEQVTFKIENDSAAVLRAGAIYEFGLGYSREVYSTDQGKLYGGVKGKYYNVQLLRDVQRLSELQEGSEDFFDNFDMDNAETSSGIGLDFGVLWVTDKYKLGATVINLNEPDFKYNSVDLSNFSDPRIKNALIEGGTYTMERQLKLEGSMYFLDSKKVVLGASLDANEIQDPVGDKYQWANASVAYITDNWLLPGGRVGYRKNMAGSELSYVEFGVTWLYVNLDFGMALEDVQIDGDSVPRGAYVNFGTEWSF